MANTYIHEELAKDTYSSQSTWTYCKKHWLRSIYK